jgi:hypothetical protein
MVVIELGGSLKDIKTVLEAAGTLAGTLATGIRYLQPFVLSCMSWRSRQGLENVGNVHDFRRKLLRQKPLDKPLLITVEGSYFPATLLSSGWWEREHEAKIPDFRWQDGLQEWLYRGFEEWAPSWDFNLAEEKSLLHFGQIGAGDEAESLPVIIQGEKSTIVRENLAVGKKNVFQATVTGLLNHRSALPADVLTSVNRYGKAFEYCILVSEVDKKHGISLGLDKRTSPYSGYLWQCWGPKEWLVGMKTPSLNEVYFLWEHTDFTKPDAVEYNLDSLNHKSEFLLKKHPNLALLQKSSSIVPGDPACPAKLFYEYILGSR